MQSPILNAKLCEKQAKRLEVDSEEHSRSVRRSFMQTFTTSSLGLGITKTGIGERGSKAQYTLRKELIKVFEAAHLDPDESLLWCPITNRYNYAPYMKAAHIFAHRHGQETITAIFGAMDPPELFLSANAMLMYSAAEKND